MLKDEERLKSLVIYINNLKNIRENSTEEMLYNLLYSKKSDYAENLIYQKENKNKFKELVPNVCLIKYGKYLKENIVNILGETEKNFFILHYKSDKVIIVPKKDIELYSTKRLIIKKISSNFKEYFYVF